MSKKLRTTEVNAVTEKVYLALAVVYILKLSFDTTLFYLSWPVGFDIVLKFLLCIVIILRVKLFSSYGKVGWLLCFLLVVTFKYSWLSTGYSFLVELILFSVGAVGIPYRKILKASFWTGLYVLLMAMLGCFTGCIDDLVYTNTENIRHSFGIVYPTDYAAHIVFLSLSGWVLYRRMTSFLLMTCTLVSAFLVYYYCSAKCGVIILCLLALVQFGFLLQKRWKKKESRMRIVAKLFRVGCMCTLPACAVLMISMTFLYNDKSDWLTYINSLLTGRLLLGRNTIDTYGIKLFGTAFEMIGLGGSTLVSPKYSFVDSSYVLILIRYGLVVLVALCVQYMWLQRKAIKAGQKKLMIAMALVAVHSAIEHHFLELAYNPFFLLTFSDFQGETEENALPLRQIRQYVPYLIGVGLTIPVVAVFPRIISYLRTIVDLLHLDLQGNRIQFIRMMTVVLFGAVFLIGCIFKIMRAFVLREQVSSKWYVALLVLVFVVAGGVLYGEYVIGKGQEEYQSDMEAYGPIIEILETAEGDVGKVFIDHIPEIYMREFDIVSAGVLAPEGAASRKNATLFVKDSAELRPLTASGYQYSELFTGGSVYTNSEAARAILEEAGFCFTDYYSRQNVINLADEVVWNGLAVTGDGGLLLRGMDESIAYGPWITMYQGGMQIEYKLKLLTNATDSETIAFIQVFSEERQKKWAQEEIPRSWFDEDGECTYLFNMDLTRDAQGIEFLLYVPDGVELEVREIHYGKVW